MSSPRQFLHVDGRRLEVAWHGPAPGSGRPTLVFLHEGLGCAALWRDFPARLASATGLSVFVYSRFGYGASDTVALPRPLSYMHEEGETILPQVLEAAGIGDAILFGHSDGASIAIIYAGHSPLPGLQGLVLEAPHVFCEDISVRSIAAAAEAYRDGDLRRRLERYHGGNVDTAFWGWNKAWLDPGFLNWNLESYLPRIAVPTLVVQGRDDEYGTTAQVDAITAQTACAAAIFLANCGHSPHRDQPEQTLSAAAAFIGRILDES